MADKDKDTITKKEHEFIKPELVLQNHRSNCSIFYGINIPKEIRTQLDANDLQLVHIDKAKCLAILKKIPNARFKVFSSIEEAEQFSKLSPPISTKEDQTLVGEKPSLFRSLKSQDLVKFRKAIEKGNSEYFEECIQSNPRYLVSSGDTPAVLQEGFRYNALHIACRNIQEQLLKRILTLVSTEDFFRRLYPDDSEESSSRRSCFLLDLYLNTPEKGLNETPLHFACKYGAIECVRTLVSYPGCERNRCNKFDQTPHEIICSRTSSQNKTLSASILSLLEDLYIVPVFRDIDNCFVPQIGVPCSPSKVAPAPLTSSPLSPTFKVRGYAGPMSPQKAESFYSQWKKSVISSSPSKFSSPLRNSEGGGGGSLGVTDLEKGLERLGRLE